MRGSYWIDESGFPNKGPHGLWEEGEYEEAMYALGWRNASMTEGVAIWVRATDALLAAGQPAQDPEGKDPINR